VPHHIRLIAWNIRVGGGRCIELITDQLLGEPASPRNSLLVASRWPVRIHPTGAAPTEPNRWILANIQTPIPFALGAMHVRNRITAPRPYFMLLAGFVEEVLGVSKSQLGSLISIQNVGSLGGSLFIASMPARDRRTMMLYSSLLLGVALIFFAASTNYWLTAGILIVVGLGQSGRMSLGNVLVQSYSEDSYRGP
jgi:MFS family permease